jgi:hypothetical protein
MTFIYAAEEGRDRHYPIAWFRSLSKGGFAAEEVEVQGIRHDNVMYDPYVRDVAVRLVERMRHAGPRADRPEDELVEASA